MPFQYLKNWTHAGKRALLQASIPQGLEIIILDEMQLHAIIAPEIIKKVNSLTKKKEMNDAGKNN